MKWNPNVAMELGDDHWNPMAATALQFSVGNQTRGLRSVQRESEDNLPVRVEFKEASAKDVEHCPKCQTPTSGQSCASCGLRKARFGTVARELSNCRIEISPLDVQWRRLLEKWHSDAEHEEFIQKASFSSDFLKAARLYREATHNAERRARAEEMLCRLQKMAMAAAFTRPPRTVEGATPQYRKIIIVLVAMALFAAAAGSLIFLQTSRARSQASASSAQSVRSLAVDNHR